MNTLPESEVQRLPDISKYVYGTTRLGEASLPLKHRVEIARLAMNAKVWFHTSHQYGEALQVLRAAFDEDRAHVPPLIVKIGWDSFDQIRDQIQQHLQPLQIERIAVGQLCLGSTLGTEFRQGGPCYEGFQQLKADGFVERLVLEVWPWNSDVAYEALKGGYPDGVVDGYIFYLNPLQRFVSTSLWELLQERDESIIAMRTVAGGDVFRLRDSERTPAYLRQWATAVAPLFERSGCRTWTEFCIRFVFGFSQVRATVGSTSRTENLQEFLDAVPETAPLSQDIQEALVALQRQWAEEHDQFAEPWSM